jgi:hypothetical protein
MSGSHDALSVIDGWPEIVIVPPLDDPACIPQRTSSAKPLVADGSASEC